MRSDSSCALTLSLSLMPQDKGTIVIPAGSYVSYDISLSTSALLHGAWSVSSYSENSNGTMATSIHWLVTADDPDACMLSKSCTVLESPPRWRLPFYDNYGYANEGDGHAFFPRVLNAGAMVRVYIIADNTKGVLPAVLVTPFWSLKVPAVQVTQALLLAVSLGWACTILLLRSKGSGEERDPLLRGPA